MDLSPPMEDYLEAVHVISHERGVTRVKDLARHLSVSDPSVVAALRTLKHRGLVVQERYGYVELTEEGRRLAADVLHRHEILASFLENVLGLDPGTAARDACRIEHAACPETIRRFQALASFLLQAGHADLKWKEEFGAFLGEAR